MPRKSAASLETALASAVAQTPWGWVRVWASDRGVTSLEWPLSRRPTTCPAGSRATAHAETAAAQVAEYLEGRRRKFDVPVDWSGLPDFTRTVLQACSRVPYGRTVSYGELAAQAGRPRAARAVGQVMARNRLPLILPCHRVLARGGGLGGYGLGLKTKQHLLDLEQKRVHSN